MKNLEDEEDSLARQADGLPYRRFLQHPRYLKVVMDVASRGLCQVARVDDLGNGSHVLKQ